MEPAVTLLLMKVRRNVCQPTLKQFAPALGPVQTLLKPWRLPIALEIATFKRLMRKRLDLESPKIFPERIIRKRLFFIIPDWVKF